MRTKAQFTADIRAAIGRGPANDTLLPVWIQETLNSLENRNTYQWMRQVDDFAIVPGATANEVVLPWTTIKKMRMVRFGLTDGAGSGLSNIYGPALRQVDPKQLSSVVPGYGGYYYFSGVDRIVMDGRPQEASTLFVAAWVYTDWSDYADGDTPPILARHYAGFKAACMMTAAANLRDATLAQIWTGIRDREEPAMISADTELQWGDRGGLRFGMDNPNSDNG